MSHRRAPAVLASVVALILVAGLVLVPSGPASAAGTVQAQGVALAPSASCRYGDVDITYTAADATDASVSFTAADGQVLAGYAGPAYQPDFSGTEHVLTEADDATPTGTVLGVYVWVGSDPPSASSTAEFFVLYRCDATGNDEGGANEVLSTCVGPYGTCPQSAEEALEPTTTTTEPTTTPTTTDPTSDVGPDSPTPDGLVIPRFAG